MAEREGDDAIGVPAGLPSTLSAPRAPESDGIVVRRRRKLLAVGTEREADDRSRMPQSKHHTTGLCVPDPHSTVDRGRRHDLRIGTERRRVHRCAVRQRL